MRAYGVRKKDIGCCPGHDKYPPQPYKNTSRSKFKRVTRARKKHARQEASKEIRASVVQLAER